MIDLEEKGAPPAPHLPGAGIAAIMAHRLESAVGKAPKKLRKETVEPFFGIVKEGLGFRRFSMRGEEKANIEWDLMSISANVKRLHKLKIGFSDRPGEDGIAQLFVIVVEILIAHDEATRS
ncbi:transposase [Akkermansiaceae bacterium]|nr:transposase [Akkermansiaceae bacterium]